MYNIPYLSPQGYMGLQNLSCRSYLLIFFSFVLFACGSVTERRELAKASLSKADHATAFKVFYDLSVNEGDPESAFHLAQLFSAGQGVGLDTAKAIRWYKFSANEGYAPAQYQLGMAYLYQFGVPLDIEQGAQWLSKAAGQQHAEASFMYAELVANERVASMPKHEAKRWYEQAAISGNAAAQMKLGHYLTNAGDTKTACHWYAQAAAQQLAAVARFHAECLTDSGQKQAWLRKAAVQGDGEAQYLLANLLQQQKDVEGQRMQPRVQAYAWLMLAAEDGHAKAIIGKGKFATSLLASDRVKALRYLDELRSELLPSAL